MINTIITSLKQHKFHKEVEKFAYFHPYTTLLAVFVGVPIFILVSVLVSSTAIMLPIAQVMGWL